MKIDKFKDMKGGWFIGNFEPSAYKNKDFEVAVHFHEAGEDHEKHYHKISTEINLLMQGRMSVDKDEEKILVPGDIFTIHPNEIVYPNFYEDCAILVIKVPSSIGDKYVSL